MRILVLFICLYVLGGKAVSIINLVNEEWDNFKATFNKRYENDVEDKFRMKIFMENSYEVAKHNKLYNQGLVTFKLAINKYADLLPYEFDRIYNGLNRIKSQTRRKGVAFIPPANVELPKTIDWREKGGVTPVKDQGECGSCYSFASTGALEGQHFRKTGKLISLSEQNLVDCSQKYGNEGCDGGTMDNSFEYVKENNGIDTEESYPYKAAANKCQYKPENKGATDTGYADIDEGNEKELQSAVATAGPVAVGVDASHVSFQLYSGGIYYEEKCSQTNLSHAVLVVGYGTDDDGNDYWIVKNSWSDGWGNDGYIKMARNRENNCGIASQASYPLV